MSFSPLDRLARMTPEDRDAYLAECDDTALELIRTAHWSMVARPEQRPPPGEWLLWVLMGGRRSGKTRAGAEWILDRHAAGAERIALVSRTASDVRDVMIEGESGIVQCGEERGWRVTPVTSRREVVIESPHGRSLCKTYSGVEPDLLAGPGHDTAWADEFATWMNERDGAGRTAFDNLSFGMSIGDDPRAILTGTPRALKAVRDLFTRPDLVHTVMSLLDNRANLPDTLVASLMTQYGGTRLGDQEIYGQLIDADGAYYQRPWFAGRILDEAPYLVGDTRFWDLAHAAPSASNPDPDFTVGVRGGYDTTADRWVWTDMRRMRGSTAEREQFICDTAQLDGPHIIQHIEQSPGAGAEIIDRYTTALARVGSVCVGIPVKGKKQQRAERPSTISEQGRLWLVAAEWNQTALDELETFPDGTHDDIADALAGMITAVGEPAGSLDPMPLVDSLSQISGGDPLSSQR